MNYPLTFPQSATAKAFMIVITLIDLMISLFIVLKIARGISKPVKEIARATQGMEEGDLSVQINVNSKDEIGKLGKAFF